MNFSDALSGLGYAVDTPRRLLYQGVVDPIARGLGHTGKPIEHFANALGALGMDEDSMLTQALGFAGDVATDPLTWAGGALGRMGARSLRGLIPHTVETLTPLEHAAATARAAAEKTAVPTAVIDAAAAGKSGPLAGASKFKGPLKDTVSMANLEWLGPNEGAFPGAIEGLPSAEGRLSGDVVRAPRWAHEHQTVPEMLDIARRSNVNEEFMKGTSGFYSPEAHVYGTQPGVADRLQRHERIHAIIDQSAKQAAKGEMDLNTLPALMRWPAKLLSGAGGVAGETVPLRRSLGTMGEELAAQTLQNRTPGNQALGALGFLFNPKKNAFYTQHYLDSKLSPWATGLYSRLPAAMVGAGTVGGAGAGAGTGTLGRYLGTRPEAPEEEE